ncbi:phosphoribosylformylglycinamidine synthase subunit PurS [Fructilactobacillus vespulae]|uniref:phosphoribosylformylglycinamidine synthase subunit PurS n=1 Tax=Fructilactobacillus vespulae TaxID=1249630 RepID=UPI0039B4D508
MYLGKVYVSYKPSVFDPQGDVIKKSLNQLGFQNIGQVKQGKYFEIKLTDDSFEEAEANLKKFTEELLINPNTETYQYDIVEDEK